MKKRFNVKKAIATAMAVAVSLTSIQGLDMIGATKVQAAKATEDTIANNVENAEKATVGIKESGYLNSEEDVDYYKFTTDGTESFYWLEMVNTSEEGYISYALYEDEDCIEEVESGFWMNPKTRTTISLKKLEKNHTYYLKILVAGYEGTVKYNFTFTSKLDKEPDTVDNATNVAIGTETRGTLEEENDVDFYKFTTDSSDSFYWFSMDNIGETGRVYYDIYADAELTQTIARTHWGVDVKGNQTDFLNKLEKNHTYYVKVAAGDESSEYRLKVTKKEDNEPDTVAAAKAFSVGSTVSEKLEAEGDVDFYKFTTDNSDSFYWFSMDNIGETGRVYYDVYADAELTQTIARTHWGVDVKGNQTDFLNKLEKNHTYYVKVAAGDESSEYRFNVTKKVDNEPDTVQTAKTFSVGKTVSEKLEAQLDVDYYKFKTDKTDSFYWFSLDNIGNSGEIYYAVFADADLTQKIGESSWGVDVKDNQTSFLNKLEKNHTYYVQIGVDNGQDAEYSFKVRKAKDDVKEDVKNAKDIELNTTYSNYKLQADADVDVFKFKTSYFTNYTLTFANVNSEGNIKYAIYSGKDCLDSQKVASGECGKKQSVVYDWQKNLKLKADKTYYVKISGNYRSENGKYKLGIYAKAPEGTSVKKSSAKKVTLGWKKLSQANGYEVYRATKRDGSYKKIKTITKNSTVKFVDKNVKKNKTYFYKVRAYKVKKGKKCYSAFSAIKSIRVK